MTKDGTFGARSAAISAGLTVRMVGNPQDHSPSRPKPARREIMPSFFLAALKVFASLIQPRRSGMYLKLGDRYGTTGEGGFEEYDGGWNATAGRTNALPITTNDALSTPRTQSVAR